MHNLLFFILLLLLFAVMFYVAYCFVHQFLLISLLSYMALIENGTNCSLHILLFIVNRYC